MLCAWVGIAFLSCNKDENCPNECSFTYEAAGEHGTNILAGNDDLTIFPTGEYSFRVNNTKGRYLKIQLELVSGDIWLYGPATVDGWNVSNYGDGQQIFILEESGIHDLEIVLPDGPNPSLTGGTFNINYFEKGDEITRTRQVIWG